MAINIAPPNFSGTAAVAGRGINNAAITVPGALGLQAYQVGAQDRQAQQQAALEQMKIRQQGEIALRQQMAQRDAMNIQAQQAERQGLLQQREMGFREKQLGMQGSQFQDEMALKQQQLGQQGSQFKDELTLKKEMLFQQQQQKEMAKMLDDKAESIHEKGAFASYGRLAMEKVSTPEEAQQLRVEIIKEATAKGFLSPEEAKSAGKVSIPQFKSMLEYKIMQFGAVKEYQAMQPTKEKGNNGTQLTIGPDGTVNYTSMPTTGVKSEAQKDIKTKDLATVQLDKVVEGYKPEYFTNRSQAGNWMGKAAEKNADIPLVGTALEATAGVVSGKSKEERAKFMEQRAGYMNNVDQLFNSYKKEITGAAAGEKEMEMLRASFMNGDMAPSEFQGALKQVVSKYKTEADYNRNVLQKGINVSPQGDRGSSSKEALRQHLRSLNKYSEDEINSYLKAN